jgi:GH25 family lysozyme M1 (1,4-beta-N-acetylmuramidase)
MPDYSQHLLGLDVYHGNGTVNAAQLAAEGISFVICKVSQGTAFRDPAWITNRDRLRAQGMIAGGYHYLTRGGGAAQADYFRALLGVDPYSLLLCVDVELDQHNVGPSYQDVLDFAARFKAKVPGHPLIVYTGRWFWADPVYLGNPNGAVIGPLWDSAYVTGSGSPATLYAKVTPGYLKSPYGGWTAETRIIRQYSSTGVAGGMSPVDCDVYWGTREQLAAYCGGVVPVPVPIPAPVPTYPAFPGGKRAYRYGDNDPSVGVWKAQMRKRGWALSTTNVFDANTNRACRLFQAEKHLTVDGLVGKLTWAAAWTAPVT